MVVFRRLRWIDIEVSWGQHGILARVLLGVVARPILLVSKRLTFVGRRSLIAHRLRRRLIMRTIRFLVNFRRPKLGFTRWVTKVEIKTLFFTGGSTSLRFDRTSFVRLVGIVKVSPRRARPFGRQIEFIHHFLGRTFVRQWPARLFFSM